ncbi:MAG TPA: LAGLIDADG family homing endonuclease [Acidimicrobiales bacterium]|nr:LAGLIDADG family homing endonuclease [Acidimicrobiales bacterium]
MAIAPQRLGIGIRRYFTTEGVHPYEEVVWERRDARITNYRDGSVAFEQLGVEVPASWSVNATNILAQKYFRGTLGTAEREWSLRQVADRVVDTITAWGTKDGYFLDDDEAETFRAELKHLVVTQKAAFNSPVWFNIGVQGVPRQASACFILAVDDRMDSILNWYVEEGTIFKGGSGAGINLSKIRSSREGLKGGGTASGPVSFMRGADASAGTIKSGGKCFREGTLVATPSGWHPIETLDVGDLVLTHDGPRRVLDFMPNGVKQCYRVQTREGYEVEVTEGHKFAYWDSNEGRFAVKPIESFSAGDSLHVLLQPSEGGSSLPLLPPQVFDKPHATTTVEMQFPTEVDDRLGYVVGLTYGDAELRKDYPYRVRVAFCKDAAGRVSAARFTKYCEELFGESPLLLGDFERHNSLGYTRKRLVDFLVGNGLATGKGDALGFPVQLFRATSEVRAAFVAGVIDADGTYQRRGGWSVSSIDREFLVQLQRLLLTLGVPSKVNLSRPGTDRFAPLYRLRVVGYTFIDRLVRLIGPYSAKAQLNYEPSPGADKGWGYRPSLLKDLQSRVETRGGRRLIERSVGTNETSGYGAVAVLESHPDQAVASYAHDLTTTVQVHLESVTPTEAAVTYDLEVEGAHLLSANGIYASNTRRAAKMVILNADHPDITDFIWCKAREERKARVLRDNGFDMDLDGADSHSMQYQNANNSVRVTDEFMQAVLDDADWHLRAVTTGEIIETVKARDLFRQISEAAWECADPGMQFDTTINRWHTAPNTDRINGSNPCSEYMHIDNSACNLASLNLLRFLSDEGVFDAEGFKAATEVVFTAQEILVGNADYPTEKIAENSRKFRQLGIGYANLGALLMAQGLPYDSDAGRAWAGAITALLTGHSYATSARTAARMGPFAGYHENADAMINVLKMHRDEVSKIDEELVPTDLLSAAQEAWDTAVELGEKFGVRNAQASVLAPTGCLVGGSLVATERGLVRLGSLGDVDGAKWQDLNLSVQTDEGPQQATKFFINGLAPVVTVTSGRGYRIQGTPEHRIKVVDRATGEWEWRRFAEIGPGDLVPLALDQLLGESQVVPLPPLPEAYWTSEHSLRVPRQMIAELAELVGYFMGDGSLHSRGLRFCVSHGDFDVVERLERLGKEVLGLAAHVTAKQGYDEVRFDSVRLALWWEACGFAKQTPSEGHTGKGYTPHVPAAVLYSNDRETYRAFLRGLFEADGTVTSGYPTWSTTSLEFSHDVQSLLLALGYPTTRKIDTVRTGWGKAPLAILRLLNLDLNRRWLDEIGFMSDRKNAACARSDTRQAARMDHIPLTRELVDRLAPENDQLRRVLLMELKRGTVSRRIASQLLDRTGDAELAHLLSYFYDAVSTAELGEEQLTYDLSVPANVTYLANGFVSHNTIGLLMDCDTTGVEPDLGLVKMKKLVGGGTMSIVNQTVPRALSRLGYDDTQVADIIAYIDEHKSIVGAPHLSPEHLPVFACSMGDNTIHYSGHVRMMGAVQPFISGAISKTINMPEEVTVEEVEQLHIDAWKLGVKAVAIYRDNCKVAQPLSTAKKDGVAVTAGGELAAKVAELEKALERQTVVVKQPIRERLPKRRRSRTFDFRVADCDGYVTVGEYDDGRPGEVFLKVSKQGSTLSGVMDAFAISISLGLQHGVPLSTYVRKYTNMRFEPAGMTDDPELRLATSLVDYIFRRLAVDYLPREEREELGILTTDERIQPTLPGVEEVATPSHGVVDVIDESTVPVPLARSEARDAPYCYQCGNVMQRAGSCYVCGSCGTTSGCS